MNKQHRSIASLMNIELLIPSGWQFYSADFSCKACSDSPVGSVMLIRDDEGLKKHLALSQLGHEEEFNKFRLYVCGSGKTLKEAVENAVQEIQKEGL